MDADEKQFAILYPKFKRRGKEGLPLLQGEVDKQPMPNAGEEAKEALAKRQANAAVANAYVADITPPEQRAKRFCMLGAMFGIGFIGAAALSAARCHAEDLGATIVFVVRTFRSRAA